MDVALTSRATTTTSPALTIASLSRSIRDFRRATWDDDEPPLGFGGLRIVILPVPTIEVPRHRKKRLAKKLRKRYGPLRIIDPQWKPQALYVDRAQGIVYCSPAQAQALRREIQALDNPRTDHQPSGYAESLRGLAMYPGV